jgi:hypothetical protein
LQVVDERDWLHTMKGTPLVAPDSMVAGINESIAKLTSR